MLNCIRKAHERKKDRVMNKSEQQNKSNQAAGTYTCKALAHGMARLDFVKKATTPSPQSTTPAPTCANGLRVGEWKV